MDTELVRRWVIKMAKQKVQWMEIVWAPVMEIALGSCLAHLTEMRMALATDTMLATRLELNSD